MSELIETVQRYAESAAAPEVDFEQLYKEHVDFVWRSVRRLGIADERAEDATQDVFLVASRRLSEFEGRASAKTWLFAIAVRVVRYYRRDDRRHNRRKTALATELGDDHSLHEPQAQAEAQRLLLQLLEVLEEERRAVFILCELEGFTAAEVGEALQINPNTVYTKLRSARLELRAAAARLVPPAEPPHNDAVKSAVRNA